MSLSPGPTSIVEDFFWIEGELRPARRTATGLLLCARCSGPGGVSAHCCNRSIDARSRADFAFAQVQSVASLRRDHRPTLEDTCDAFE
jgi:hypothetical protein